MKRSILSVCIACAILGLISVSLGFEWSATPVTAEEAVTVTIQVSPSTIVMSSLGGCVSVHTDINCASVVRKTVELNGLTPYRVEADSRGDLVAKFNLDAVKAIVSPPSTILTLTGETVTGATFSGSEEVSVRENK